ncbi:MAG TPA: hypothetical protein VFX39_05750, partial [Gemmatimonadaceae bacterium]|nr:hypothetical protein [Gemmatimonadaceae bacterium]
MIGEPGREPDERRGAEVVRVACLMSDAELGHAVERLLRTWMPEVEFTPDATGSVRELPAVDAILVDAPEAGERALEPLRRVRAAG